MRNVKVQFKARCENVTMEKCEHRLIIFASYLECQFANF